MLNYLQSMKRLPLPGPQHPAATDAPYELVVVSPRTRSARPRTVTVEWRDAAGELHCDVLSPEQSKAWIAN